jgi:hypothetical protein
MNGQRIIRASDFSQALDLAAANPAGFIEVFVASWSEVDQHRAQAAALGLAGRIGIHHQSALDALIELEVLPGPKGPPRRRSGTPASRHLNSFIRAAASILAPRLTLASSH